MKYFSFIGRKDNQLLVRTIPMSYEMEMFDMFGEIESYVNDPDLFKDISSAKFEPFVQCLPEKTEGETRLDSLEGICTKDGSFRFLFFEEKDEEYAKDVHCFLIDFSCSLFLKSGETICTFVDFVTPDCQENEQRTMRVLGNNVSDCVNYVMDIYPEAEVIGVDFCFLSKEKVKPWNENYR